VRFSVWRMRFRAEAVFAMEWFCQPKGEGEWRAPPMARTEGCV